MRVPIEWLAEYVDPGSDPRELGQRQVRPDELLEPFDGDAHQLNCSRNRRSLS